MAFVPRVDADGSAIAELTVTPPRAYGWRIGDRLQRDIVLRLHAPYRFDAGSLPAAGRHTHWLALAPPRIDERRGTGLNEYRIRLDYQLVNVSPDHPDIALPELLLRFGDGKETQQALIPASRLRVGTITDFEAQGELRPAQPPLPLPLPTQRLAAAAGVLVAALAGLAWLRWGGAYGRRSRPFMALKRRLAMRREAAWEADAYAEALRAVHRAFDTTAGRTVFGETLAGFLAEHARYVVVEGDIREFFRRSATHFYRPAAAAPAYTRAELFAFVARCADIERGLA
ncbi:MAG: hypothetical protein AB7I32_19880 [Gammaproteobacteria bacterium]